MRKIFTKYLFFLLITLFGFGYILAYFLGDEQTFGINKTVGWAYEISDQDFYSALIFTSSQILFIIGYLIILIIGRKTNYYLSIAHFKIIILSLVFFENSGVNMIFYALSLIVFFTNIFKSHK